MKLRLTVGAWYSDQPIELEVPDRWRVRQLVPDTPRPLIEDELSRAFAEPVGQPRLRDLAKGKARPLIVVDDLTRPTPTDRLLPHMLHELAQAGIAASNVTVLMAIGTHAPPSEPAIRLKVGAKANDCRVLVHDMLRDVEVEQAGRGALDVAVYTCAPLQVLAA